MTITAERPDFTGRPGRGTPTAPAVESRPASAPGRSGRPTSDRPAPGEAPRPEASTAPAEAPRPNTSASRTVMNVVVIGAALLISAGAARESFYAFENLAIFFGWPETHAWTVMPIVELFLAVGAFELALRIIEDGKTWGPRLMSYIALLVTLAVNITYHVLTLLLPTDADGRIARGLHLLEVEVWHAIILAAFAAIVPLAQLAALHVFAGRLQSLAESRRAGRPAQPSDDATPSISKMLRRAAVDRIAERLTAPPAAAPLAGATQAGATQAGAEQAEEGAAPRGADTAPAEATTAPAGVPRGSEAAPPRGNQAEASTAPAEAPRPAPVPAPRLRRPAPAEATPADDDNVRPIANGEDSIRQVLELIVDEFGDKAESWDDFLGQLADQTNQTITVRKIMSASTRNGGSEMGRRRIQKAINHTDMLVWPATLTTRATA